METEKQREKLPDILKGFAIILVVLGHCIQEGSGESFSAQSLYFYDRWYQFIYSFHMPLFMLVSGYMCGKSMEKAKTREDRTALLRRRVKALLSPIFFWTTFEYIYNFIKNPATEGVTPGKLIFNYFYGAVNTLWFLWAVLWCFLIVYVMHCYLRDNAILYGIGFLVMFFIPDGIGLGAYKFMLPYFTVAFYAYKYIHRNIDHLQKTLNLWSVAAAGILFFVLFHFYDETSFIYLTGYKLIGKDAARQLVIDGYRTLTGFAGSVFFILMFRYILKRSSWKGKLLAALGTDTMGIFIFSGYLTLLGLKELTRFSEPSHLLNLAETAVLLPMSWGLTRLISKVPVLRRFAGK